MSDPALDWLLENDPEATDKSHREYAREAGIINGSISRDIAHKEMQRIADDKSAPFHCPMCRRKETIRRHTVE